MEIDANVEEQAQISRRAIKIKNLEKEVNIIISQDERDEIMTEDGKIETDEKKIVFVAETPKRSQSLILSQQTPRRSTRKSCKPAQDYNDIVLKSLRSATKANKENETLEEKNEDVPQEKWTPAKVGRFSKKRGRKTRRNTAFKKSETTNNEEADSVLEKTNDELELVQNTSVLPGADQNNLSVVETFVENEIGIAEKDEITENIVSPVKKGNELNSEHNTAESSDDGVEMNQTDFTLNLNANKTNNSAKDSAIGMSSENTSEHFGSYLKANKIDISDLGIEPLEANKEKEELFEEMPSLIVCDDFEEDENEIENANQNTNEDDNIQLEQTLDTTFDTSDCIIISEQRASTPNKPQSIKQQIADTIVMNEVVPDQDLGPPSNKKVRINPEQILDTPKQSSKAYRFPTPYKNKLDCKFKNASTEQNDQDDETARLSSTLPITSISIKDSILRSIRKRSLSVGIEGKQEAEPKRIVNRVFFHSPANQTALIEDVDVLMANNHNKSIQTQSCKKTERKDNKNITLRRRRSMSVDDIYKLNVPKQVNEATPKKQASTPQKSGKLRTKLPNFAAIHQKQFQKMENLADHVARKAERAKILTNSGNKIRKPVSEQKIVPPDSGASKTEQKEKRKAIKKLNLLGDELKTSHKTITTTINTAADTTDGDDENILQKLPKPKPILNRTIPAAPSRIPTKRTAAKAAAPALAVGKSNKSATSATNNTPAKVLKPTQLLNLTANPAPAKPTFNLSTTVSKFNTSHVPKTTTTTDGGATNRKYENKMASRRQRHMDMFKSRNGRGSTESTHRQIEIIRGVRSNRRFDLQMQHRRNLEQ